MFSVFQNQVYSGLSHIIGKYEKYSSYLVFLIQNKLKIQKEKIIGEENLYA